MGQEVSRKEGVIVNPTNYDDMVAKLKEQEERNVAGVLNKHKVNLNPSTSTTSANQTVPTALIDIAKQSVAARNARTFSGNRPETASEARQPVARDIIRDSSDPAVTALQAQLESEIARSKAIASRANVTHQPPRSI